MNIVIDLMQKHYSFDDNIGLAVLPSLKKSLYVVKTTVLKTVSLTMLPSTGYISFMTSHLTPTFPLSYMILSQHILHDTLSQTSTGSMFQLDHKFSKVSLLNKIHCIVIS